MRRAYYWILLALAVTVGLTGFGVFRFRYKNASLKKCTIQVVAFLEDVYKLPKGYIFVYTYKIRETDRVRLKGVDLKGNFKELQPGDSVLIEYACSDPGVSELKSLFPFQAKAEVSSTLDSEDK
jgi:hypothetical protein